MIKDYRQTIKNLMDMTDNTQDSLKYSLQALKSIIKNVESAEEKNTDKQTISISTNKKDSPKESFKKDKYYIKRTLTGCTIYKDNKNIRAYPESMIRSLNLKTGMTCELDTDDIDNAKLTNIDKTTGYDDITTLQYAPVKYNEFTQHFYVDSDISGNPLSDFNNSVSNFIISNTNNKSSMLHENDIVELAWYNTRPDMIDIRWIYDTTALNTNFKKESTKNKNISTVKSSFETILDFDLKNKTVAIIVGAKQNSYRLIDLIKAHNGIPKIINGFKKSNLKNYFESELSDCDIAILVQNLSKHSNSNEITKIISNTDISFAVSNSLGTNSLERAIYRALTNQPAYETATLDIHYPTKG